MEHLLLVSIGVVYATSPPPSWTHPADRLQYTPTIAKPSGFVILGIIFIYFSQSLYENIFDCTYLYRTTRTSTVRITM